MKILFLDIDGVVNSRLSTDFRNNLYPIDPYMAFLVGRIQLQTGCEVVLSSSWRLHPDGIQKVRESIVDVLDKTPYLGGPRGNEIKWWLDNHPEVEKYAILDDDSDFYPDQHLFKTTFEEGLTDEIAEAVIKHLNS